MERIERIERIEHMERIERIERIEHMERIEGIERRPSRMIDQSPRLICRVSTVTRDKAERVLLAGCVHIVDDVHACMNGYSVRVDRFLCMPSVKLCENADRGYESGRE